LQLSTTQLRQADNVTVTYCQTDQHGCSGASVYWISFHFSYSTVCRHPSGWHTYNIHTNSININSISSSTYWI